MERNRTTNRMVRRDFIRTAGFSLPVLVLLPSFVFGSKKSGQLILSGKILNPTPHDFHNEPVRINTLLPLKSGPVRLLLDGKEIPGQAEVIDGKIQLWMAPSLKSGAASHFEVVAGTPAPSRKQVTIQNEKGFYVLENGKISVKIPANSTHDTSGPSNSAHNIPGPLAGIQLANGPEAGSSFWKTDKKLKKFTASIVGDGTLFAKIRLRYEFEGEKTSASEDLLYAELDIMLAPGWEHVSISEHHHMGPDDYWEFEMSHGWSPRNGISKQFNNGPGGDSAYVVPPMDRPLVPIENVSFSPGLYINLIPRWNQHYKDGWAFAASDGKNHLAAVAVTASQWEWPHDNNLQCMVKPEGDYAGVRCSTWHGKRLWWLSPFLAPMDTGYIRKHAWENIDKINHDYQLEWPGKKAQWWSVNPYDSEQTNPTHTIRRIGKELLKTAGQPADETTLIRFQTLIHPDCFGSYWNYFSPENPNFFTDYNLVPIALATNLKEHPQFEQFRKLAENKFKEDLYHSVTLPGGAGQECPGYSHYGMTLWSEIVEMGSKHLGFEMNFIHTRMDASEKFYKRISYPDGQIRRGSPVGDSHPDRAGNTGMPKVEVEINVVKSWKTEEFPGFGVLFCNNPGTEKETYLSFKSGPNRCHYHGDQLAFHYCANNRPLAVDHHCSYRPRAGQEHMHNRLAFFTDEFPFANMDGYERVLAVKTSEYVDVAVGQVESRRLRKVQALPPEIWDTRYPQLEFDQPLVYRRTIVLMKTMDQDYFVIRDQYWADRPLKAAFCLHTYGEKPVRKGNLVDFGILSLFCTHADFSMKNFDWSHDNGGHEETKGVRLEISGQKGEMITVMYPGNKPPEIKAVNGGVQVGADVIVFRGDRPDPDGPAEIFSASRSGKMIMTLAGEEIEFERWQGEVGLFVPDAGYPFGEIPGWLIRQRAKKPDWIHRSSIPGGSKKQIIIPDTGV